MPSVKQSQALLLCFSAAFASLAGCQSGDLSRFAPPEIVKYEDLAGDQPINPEVAARIEARRNEEGAGKFPRIAETPDETDRPIKKPKREIAEDAAMLVDARDALAEDVTADRVAADADKEQDLTAQSQTLQDRIKSDTAAAARERREKLTPLSGDGE